MKVNPTGHSSSPYKNNRRILFSGQRLFYYLVKKQDGQLLVVAQGRAHERHHRTHRDRGNGAVGVARHGQARYRGREASARKA